MAGGLQDRPEDLTVDVIEAVRYWGSLQNAKLPEAFLSFDRVDRYGVASAAEWVALEWDPDTGRGVVAKPSWTALKAAWTARSTHVANRRVEEKRRHYRMRIATEAYGAVDQLDEIHRRMNGEATPEQHARAAAIRKQYRAAKRRIQDS